MGRTAGGGALKLVKGCIATKLYVKPKQHMRGGNPTKQNIEGGQSILKVEQLGDEDPILAMDRVINQLMNSNKSRWCIIFQEGWFGIQGS